jgi:3-hydroxybutyryl-CoA dehydrogenase
MEDVEMTTGASAPATTVTRTEIANVGVVGCGLMGAGIAEVCIRSGANVVVVDTDLEKASVSRRRLEAVSEVERDRSGSPAKAPTLLFDAHLESLVDSDLVIEAVTEDLRAKEAVLRQLDRIIVSRDAIIASNTSSIAIGRLGAFTQRPESVVGMHFFYPVPAMSLVEVVPSLLTSDTVTLRAELFVTQNLGKSAIRAKDHAGFVVNRLLVPYLLNAVRLVEMGFASPDDIDKGMVGGCGFPLGPLRVLDLIGLDTLRAASLLLYEEFGDLQFLPPPLLSRMVEAGSLGRKSGRGFYEYSVTP